jgi:long-subunit acyl-CoA synthetase (AMP-forming)
MKGYYKNPDATQKVIDGEGWFHTGSLATKGADGFYRLA